MKRQPTEKTFALRDKLQALAERGVNGEQAAAKLKLQRLEACFDFSVKIMRTADIFAGFRFSPSSFSLPVFTFAPSDYDVANAVKWAIEQRAGIQCLYRDGELAANATPKTIEKLSEIAGHISASFLALWRTWQSGAGNSEADRNVFMLGLYEGMMGEERQGQLLPARSRDTKAGKAKKKSVGRVAGISLHPYTVAVGLGRNVRFSVPLTETVAQLERTIKGEIEDANRDSN